MPTQRRYTLKSKEAKQIIEQINQTLKLDFDKDIEVEVVESDVGEIYLIGSKPLLFKSNDRILPTLLFGDFIVKASKVIVDMGAVPYVCKGATVMAPGIVRIEGEFGDGDLVIVADMKHGKALALGESLMDSLTARQTKKGPVVKTLHYVSDKIWDYIKTISD
jgi:PUA domain protein